MSGSAAVSNHVEDGMKLSARPPQRDARFRDEHIVEPDRMAARPAHAQRVPVVQHADALRLHRNGKMQHLPAFLGIL